MLSHVKLQSPHYLHLEKFITQGRPLLGKNFNTVDLTGSNFNEVQLRGSSFYNVDMESCRFSNVSFMGVQIESSELAHMKINGILVTELLRVYESTLKK
ncbi:pentapeptide repeat-containing protein [Undibacterium sp. TJN19]|uniref:pentapeptide repeat-containing protein n=1 Tax=Undibacterium sp. TJN19 TaxID=3413055 RepID=UPI003BF5CCA6